MQTDNEIFESYVYFMHIVQGTHAHIKMLATEVRLWIILIRATVVNLEGRTVLMSAFALLAYSSSPPVVDFSDEERVEALLTSDFTYLQ